jgi:hypothetical protein
LESKKIGRFERKWVKWKWFLKKKKDLRIVGKKKWKKNSSEMVLGGKRSRTEILVLVGAQKVWCLKAISAPVQFGRGRTELFECASFQ